MPKAQKKESVISDSEIEADDVILEHEMLPENLIHFISAHFIDSQAAKIDADIEVEINFEYLTNRTPPFSVYLMTTYNGTTEIGPNISPSINGNMATTTLNLKQPIDYYFSSKSTNTEKIECRFGVRCEDTNECISESIFLSEKPFQISIGEITDTLFNTTSTIPLLDAEGGLINSLAACFEYCAEYPDKEIICYGHTDTTGEPDANLSVSEFRALAVKALLSNDSALWRECINAGAQVIDYQAFLNNICHYSEWDCDPGPIDGIDGSRTKQGIKEFQRNYNQDYSGALVVDGIIGPNTWSAIQDTITTLSIKQSGADPKYINPRFYSPNGGIMPCGESCSIEKIGLDGLVSINDRRVEVHFHERPNPPSLPTPEPQIDISAIDSYNKEITDIHYISISSIDGENWLDICLKGQPKGAYSNKPFKLVFPDNTEYKGRLDNGGCASVSIGTAAEAAFYIIDEDERDNMDDRDD
ncbi:MAG: peptidoglycan-binding protein, partial [Fibrobacterales bacterium]